MLKNGVNLKRGIKALAVVFAIGYIFSFSQVQAATTIGANISTDGYLKIGTAVPGVPVVGMIYYDSGTNKFRCYEGAPADWVDCIGGISGTVLVNQGGTNITSYTAGDLLYATGATTLSKLPIGNADDILTVSGGIPTWAASTPLVITNTYVKGFLDSNPGNDCVSIAGAQIGDVCIVTGAPNKSYICANATCALSTDWKELLTSSGSYLEKANNLSDVANVATSRTNLGLGTGDSPTFTGLNISGYMDFNTAVIPPSSPGRLFYDSVQESMSYYTDIPGLEVNIGQRTLIRVANVTGSSIPANSIVYITGATASGIPTVDLAQADSANTSKALGIASKAIASGSEGFATTFGMIYDIDTSSYSAGDPIYLSQTTPGDFQTARPIGSYEVPVGFIGKSDATTGTILIYMGTKVATAIGQGEIGFGSVNGYIIGEGANLFWDDTNNRLGIGTNTPAYDLDVAGDIKVGDGSLFYLGTNAGVPAPTAAVGSMYYDTGSNKFKCYDNTGWVDCDTTSGTATLQNAYNGGATIATAGGTDIALTLTSIGEDFTVSGAGAVSLTPTGASSFTSGAGLTLTGGATSTWGTSAGDLNLAVNGADTGNVQIGTGGAGTATPDYLAFDVKSTTGDPVGGAEGYMYYNTFDNKFRCYENAAWTDCISVSSAPILSSIIAATAANSINNGDYAQTWNWNLTTADKAGFTFGENTASVATGAPSILKASTLGDSTAMPLFVENLGDGNSFRVNDSSGDMTPFFIDENGSVGIGTDSFDSLDPEKLKVESPSVGGVSNVIAAYGTKDGPIYSTIRNRSSGVLASSAMTATADDGDTSVNYAAAGITSSGYNDPSFPIAGPHDAFFFNVGDFTGTQGGNMIIGTVEPGMSVKFISGGGAAAANEQMRIDGSGNVGIHTTSPGSALDVKGELRLSGSTSGYVGFVPAAVAGSQTYTLPSADGSPGQALVTSGSGAGVLSWASASSNWQRNTTTLSPLTAGDDITTSGDIYTTTSTGNITSSGLLTGQLGLTVSGAAISLNDNSNFNTTINTGTSTGTVNIGSSNAGAITVTSGAASSFSTTAGNITLQPGGTGTANVQIGDGGVASATPDMLVLDIGSADPLVGTNGAMYYSTNTNSFRCYINGVWDDCAGVALSSVTAATTSNTITNGDNAQVWNWNLSTAAKTAFSFGENSASTNGVGAQNILGVSTQSSSTATPLYVNNLGAANSFRVDDESGDSTPFVIDAAGNVVIGNTTPSVYGEKLRVDVGSGGGQFTFGGTGTVNSNLVVYLQNYSSGGNATSDFVAAADNGSPADNFMAVGINSSTFNNGLFTIAGPNDAHVLSMGNDLDIGTGKAGKIIKFHTGDTLAANERMRITDAGVGIGTLAAPSYPLEVNGAIRSGLNGTDGQLRIYSEQGGTDYEAVFNPNAAMTQNTIYTLPADDGTSGQLLSTDGSGGLSWATSVIAADSLNFTEFSDTLALDTATSIALSNFDLTTNGTGNYSVSNTGTAGITPTLGLTLTGGAASTWSTTAGDLTINSGTTTPAGLNLGTAGTNAVNIGNAGSTFALTSSGGLNVTTGGALTGVASIDTIATSATALTFAGAGTLSSGAATALTINSGTTGDLLIGTDAGAETINIGTGAAVKTLTIGSTNTTSSTLVQSGSGNITLQAAGTGTGNVQIGAGGAGSSTPDLFILDVKSDTGDPATAQDGAMYYNEFTNKFKCHVNGSWSDCDTTGGTPTLQLSYNGGNTISTASSADIEFTLASGDFKVKDSGGTNTLFDVTGAGAVSATPTAALTLTGGAASTWGTSAGDLTLVANGTGSGKVRIGTGSTLTTPDMLVVDSGSVAPGSPVNGAMYYDTVLTTFRCYEAGGWQNCGTTAASATTLNQAYTAGPTITTASAQDVALILTSGDFKVKDSGGINTLFDVTGAGAVSATPTGALTLTGGAASTWSTSAGNLNVDSAAVLNLGTTNATSVVVGNATGASNVNILAGTGNITFGTSDTTGTLVVLDTKTNAVDPVGVNGAMYYNATAGPGNVGRFRCYEAGAWKDCDSSGSITLQQAYNSGQSINLTSGALGISGVGALNLTPTAASQFTSGGALTLTGGATSTWSVTGAGNDLTVDAADVLSLGTANATAVNIGKAGVTTTNVGSLQLGQNGTDGQLIIFSDETVAGADQAVTFLPNANMTQDVTYTLPADDGSANNVLQTDGSGNLAWASNTIVANSLDYTDFKNAMALDASTSVAFGANNYTYNLDSTGDFLIQDNGDNFAQFLDDGTITLGKATVSGTLNIGIGTGNDTINIGTGAIGADIIDIGSANAGNLTINSGTLINIGKSGIVTTNKGQLNVDELLNAKGNVDLGDANTDTITFSGLVDSAIIPSTNNANDLGTSLNRWKKIYAQDGIGALDLGTDGNSALIGYDTATNKISFDPDGNSTADIFMYDTGAFQLANLAADPAGAKGMMYYNTVSDVTMCYENNTWVRCGANAPSSTTLNEAYTNGATITTAGAIDINFALAGGNFTASGAGSVDLTPTGASSFTSGGALTLTGGAASTWGTTAGNLNLQAAGTGTTANVQIGVGGAGSANPDYLALDVKSSTGDPANGAEGYMYYNTVDNKFRCFQATGWTDCIGLSSTILTTKGDLIAYSTSPVRLPIGTNGQVLTADTGSASGMKWAAGMPGGTTNNSTIRYDTGSSAWQENANFTVTSAGTASVAAGQSYTGAGAVTLSSGAATALTINSGTTGAIDIGTDGSAEIISIGTGAAAKTVNIGNGSSTGNVAIGNSTGTFALTSSGGLNVTTGGALTGVTSIDTIATSATALTFAGAGTVSSTGANALTLDSGTTGNVNLGTGATAKNIKIGNATGATNVNVLAGTGNVTIGTSDATGTLLVLDTKNNAGDPTGTAGAMYYNSSEGKFKCYENGAWVNCISAGSIGLQQAYNAGNTITTSGGNAVTITTPTTSNNTGLIIQQNNNVNNPVALQIINAGTGDTITAPNWSITKNGIISTSGNINATGTGAITSAGILTGQAGLTVSGGAINLNTSGTGITAIGNATGTFALTSNGGLNVTTAGIMTGGTWQGNTIGIAYGGTNSTATPTNGGIAYGTGTAYAFSAVGTAGQCLKSSGAGAPTWGPCSTTPQIAQVYASGSTAITNLAGTVIALNSSDFLDSNYTLVGNTVRINVAGTYKISYNISSADSVNSRENVKCVTRNNASSIPRSESYSYGRNQTDAFQTNTATFYETFAQNDVVDIYCNLPGSIYTANTIANEAWMTLEFIR